MGAYLDRPRTAKDTETGTMDLQGLKDLPFVVSSMQGWRKNMEDAHIAESNLEKSYDVPPGTSLFAVFDGHGGKEVSLFCAKYFLETLMNLESFKARAYREALVEAFHEIDEMLKDKKYRAEIDRFAGIISTESLEKTFETLNEGNVQQSNTLKDDDSEATPERTKASLLKVDDKEELENDRRELEKERKSSLEREFGRGNSDITIDDPEDKSTGENSDISVEEIPPPVPVEDDTEVAPKINHALRSESTNFGLVEGKNAKTEEEKASEKQKKGDKEDDSQEKTEGSTSEPADGDDPVDSKILDELEGGDDTKKADTEDIDTAPPPVPPRTDTNGVEDDLNAAEAGGRGVSRAEALQLMLRVLNMQGDNKKDEGKDEPNELAELPEPTMDEVNLPTHAGTTACVALIIEGKIYVANAGDSRAVLCRDLKAEPMSFDHKPENPIEKTRIEAAGGWVTAVGKRVCGNLNLSRCIGDLKYKLNTEIDRAAQIITAEPDIKVVDIQKKDMFLVIACDGVWDILTNDSILEFVGRRLVQNRKDVSEETKDRSEQELLTMKVTVEDVFTECLCEDPMRSEGKGGDNMTCIIVCLMPLEEILKAFWEHQVKNNVD